MTATLDTVEDMSRSSKKHLSIVAALAAIPLVFALAGCASGSANASGDDADDTVTIGVVGKSDP